MFVKNYSSLENHIIKIKNKPYNKRYLRNHVIPRENIKIDVCGVVNDWRLPQSLAMALKHILKASEKKEAISNINCAVFCLQTFMSDHQDLMEIEDLNLQTVMIIERAIPLNAVIEKWSLDYHLGHAVRCIHRAVTCNFLSMAFMEVEEAIMHLEQRIHILRETNNQRKQSYTHMTMQSE